LAADARLSAPTFSSFERISFGRNGRTKVQQG
jgi:hypothetical protein